MKLPHLHHYYVRVSARENTTCVQGMRQSHKMRNILVRAETRLKGGMMNMVSGLAMDKRHISPKLLSLKSMSLLPCTARETNLENGR